ncbi:hypothetical protein HPT25_04360 [Bacillus sp. BRMEA1]|nr:hypothetical protein [Neobacillus endophyticus]
MAPKGKPRHDSTGSFSTSDFTTSDYLNLGLTSGSSSSRGRGRRRYCAGDVVQLRFNPTNDAVLSVFVAGSILPCSIPVISPGPLPTPTPVPVPAATQFMSCLIANGFSIQSIVALTPTDVLVTLVRC